MNYLSSSWVIKLLLWVQIVNILGSTGYVVSITTIQLCIVAGSINKWARLFQSNFIYNNWCLAGFGPQLAIVCLPFESNLLLTGKNTFYKHPW